MRKAAALFIALAVVTACSDVPSASSDSAPSSAPRLDGGVFGGSGNIVSPLPESATQGSTNEPAAASFDATADSTGTTRGGVFGGSGN